MQKVATSSIVTDEVVVANISEGIPMKIGASEGLHMIGSYMYNNLNLFKDDFRGGTEDTTHNEVASNGGFPASESQ
jgi:hypothetical protein